MSNHAQLGTTTRHWFAFASVSFLLAILSYSAGMIVVMNSVSSMQESLMAGAAMPTPGSAEVTQLWKVKFGATALFTVLLTYSTTILGLIFVVMGCIRYAHELALSRSQSP